MILNKKKLVLFSDLRDFILFVIPYIGLVILFPFLFLTIFEPNGFMQEYRYFIFVTSLKLDGFVFVLGLLNCLTKTN